VLFAVGCAGLAAISWSHSAPFLSAGVVFPDLGGGKEPLKWLRGLQIATLSWLFAVYVLVLHRWRHHPLSPAAVARIGVVPGACAVLALPANTTDIMSYVALGRVALIHGVNPYLHPPSEVLTDFLTYVTWDLPLPYGPLVIPPFMLAAWVSTKSVILSLVVLKTVWLAAHVCSCRILYGILTRARLEFPAAGVFLFAYNPLVVLEHLINGHNDGLMILGIVCSIWAVQRGRNTLAILAALLAVLVKSPAALFSAPLLALLIRQRDVPSLVRGGAISALALAIVGVLFFPNGGAIAALTAQGWYAINSLHVLVIQFTEARWGFAEVFAVDRRVSGVLLIVFALWRATYVRDVITLIREATHLFLALLIGYAAWFFPWYVTWVVPLAAMSASPELRRVVVLYTWTVLILYAIPADLGDSGVLRAGEALRILLAHGPAMVMLIRAKARAPDAHTV
jgi:hypothetical protein